MFFLKECLGLEIARGAALPMGIMEEAKRVTSALHQSMARNESEGINKIIQRRKLVLKVRGTPTVCCEWQMVQTSFRLWLKQLESTLHHALHHSTLDDAELHEFLSGLQESVLAQLLETCSDFNTDQVPPES